VNIASVTWHDLGRKYIDAKEGQGSKLAQHDPNELDYDLEYTKRANSEIGEALPTAGVGNAFVKINFSKLDDVDIAARALSNFNIRSEKKLLGVEKTKESQAMQQRAKFAELGAGMKTMPIPAMKAHYG